jgi:hypothetical protein
VRLIGVESNGDIELEAAAGADPGAEENVTCPVR